MEKAEGGGGMTWAAMKVPAAEVERRQSVCVRMNKLWHKRNNADKATQKRIDRELSRIRADESHWLKDAAYWLY